MNDFRVVIDAGHGGTDPGAVSNNTKEKDLTLDISKYMYERFLEKGVPVTLIRSTDETISPSERVRRILDAYGNNPNVIVISNHINSNETGTAQGAEVIYALRNEDTLARNILNSLGEAGQTIRSYYQRRLPNDPSKDYYFIHRDTGVTQPVIVEYGFINNANDLNRIKTNYKKYVDAVVQAVIDTENGIPSLEGTTYIVQKGDTLLGIARRYNVAVDALKRMNNLSTDTITLGQLLRIPTSIPDEPSLPNMTTVYTVQSGDSLWLIARKYNTNVDTIKALNNLTAEQIMPGQILRVPISDQAGAGNTTTYIVKKGDSLWLIAKRYNTTIDAIRKSNNLINDLIHVAQVLKIPVSEAGSSDINITYMVKKGDTLWGIAKTYDTTVNSIMMLNNLTNDEIFPGQMLKIY